MSHDGMSAIPTGPLRLAPGLRTRTDSAGHVLVDTPLGGIVDAGPDGLSILALFARPRTVSDAVATLKARPEAQPQLMPALAALVSLVEAGAVIEEVEDGVDFGWADPGEHARMLNDVRRTDSYLAAIAAAVRPDDVVLDIGTGSGILAVAAARAGARHVYAVEATDIAAVASEVFEANAVADRVTLLEGWSTQIDLPEPATLLVTETLGVEPFEEDILGAILDARQRLLAPGARLIPNTLRVQVQALAVPDVDRWASRVDGAAVEEWRRRYGIDLGALVGARRQTSLHWPVDGRIVAAWESLSPATELLRVDLDSFTSTGLRAGTQLDIAGTGVVNAILVTFTADLHGDIQLAHRPRPGEISSWDVSVWFPPQAIEVAPGARLGVEYRFGVAGEADGVDCWRLPSSDD